MNRTIVATLLGLGLVAGPGLDRPVQAHSFYITIGGATPEAAVITDADIVEYRFAEHAMVVRTDALSRIPPLTASGKRFDVVVEGERIYSGLFVPNSSTRSYRDPTIRIGGEDRNTSTVTLLIRRAYYGEPRFQVSTDPRSDDRIRHALTAAGKLTEGNIRAADYDATLTDRIANILEECKPIVPGTTREDLLGTFMPEGGLSTARRRTFVHRRCPFIKVDVEFGLSGPGQKPTEERLADPIRSISKPYLAWGIID